MRNLLFTAAALCVAMPAMAQLSAKPDAPIEIASDQLEVLQEQNKAIFTGNVIARQGDITMRAKQMTVFYKGQAAQENAPANPTGGGIDRIESTGDVVFVTPKETAQGDKAVFTGASNTVDLVGNVVLTQGDNILKGSKLNYNLTTGRSVLSGGRVRGLFVPGSEGK